MTIVLLRQYVYEMLETRLEQNGENNASHFNKVQKAIDTACHRRAVW